MRSALLTSRLACRSWRRWIDKTDLVKAMSEFVTGPAGDYMYRLDFGGNIFLTLGHALLGVGLRSQLCFGD